MLSRLLLFTTAAWLFRLPAMAVDFNREVRPIISEKCFACHGPDEKSRKAKMRLDVREEALKERDGVRAIVPGDLSGSEMILRILSKDPDEVMPPPEEQHALTAPEIATLQAWVKEGAPYAAHWGFVRPVRPALPAIQDGAAPPIDRLIEEKLRAAALAPAPEADKFTLVRRVSLDLIGLPPTPQETEAFVNDASPAAFERLVDRLLASEHFGERWAKMWLDLARYADSTGYGSDALRLNIWPWRDWLIGAFNRNLPYDQFTIQQLAGDLLPNATPDQIAATAFHRNTMTNTEGGTDDEEFRVAAVKDRVATTMEVWMGLTAQCAQCHSHKFDPLSHREYYQLFAVFNQTEDADRNDDEPKLPMPSAEERARIAALQKAISELDSRGKAITPEFETELHAWEADATRPVPWQPLPPAAIAAKHGSTLSRLDDHSIRAGGLSPPSEICTVRVNERLTGVTAFRLEALPDDALPMRGPGRATGGNAVVTDFSVQIVPNETSPPRGRFVRVTLPGENTYLMLAEVEVFSGGANVGPRGKASASSSDFDGLPARANDGKTDGHFFNGKSVSHTRKEKNPWWEVDLGAAQAIERIAVWGRTDSDPGVLKNFRVELLDEARQTIWTQLVQKPPNPSTQLSPSGVRTVALKDASADLSPSGFAPSLAIDGDPQKTGWSLAGGAGAAHAAVFETAQPITVPPDAELVFSIAQASGTSETLGRFRISATTAPGPVRELDAKIRTILALEPSEREAGQREALANYFRPISKTVAEIEKQLSSKRAELAAIKPVQVPVLRERSAKDRRKTFILNKGNYLAPGEPVSAALPQAFHPAPAPEADRLALAKWIVAPENPLTARVAVNRFWAQLFGKGIVETEEDFGTQGALPSHPELLDWLALDFIESGWDTRKLLKQIVLSRTYQRSSRVAPEHLQKDPKNRLLAHFPRRRLDAESVRDQAVQLAGLLSRKIGGPSVYPPQPDGLWKVAFNGGQNAYPTSKGEDRYRRGLYTFWRRTMPNPTMTTFDAPSRETCTLRRSPTNTPLQAFVTLNDPVFVECAQGLARRIIAEGGTELEARLRYALRLCLARPPAERDLAPLRLLFDEALATYRKDEAAAKQLATDPLHPHPSGVPLAEVAAWTVVANVLLNLDAVLTKG